MLYNFAGIFPVDFTFRQTKLFLFSHMTVVTAVFAVPVIFVMGFYNFGQVYENTRLEATVLSSNKVFYGLGSAIEFCGLLSLAFFAVHWKRSILPLYSTEGQAEDNAETAAN